MLQTGCSRLQQKVRLQPQCIAREGHAKQGEHVHHGVAIEEADVQPARKVPVGNAQGVAQSSQDNGNL